MDMVLVPEISAAERTVTAMSLQMMSFLNGKERTEVEWRRLFEAADPAFIIADIRRPQGSILSLINLRLDGQDEVDSLVDKNPG